MGTVLAVPYVPSGEAIESLASLPRDALLSTVAVNVDGHLLSMNYPQLQPGDVFLFDGGKPDPLLPRAIPRFQARIFGDEANVIKWRHVGILDRNFQVWDAMPSLNVRARPLREVLVDVGRICVVRPKKPIDPDRLSEGLLEFSRGQYRIFTSDTAGELVKRLLVRLPVKERSSSKQEDRCQTRIL
ncbi:hypothetical protein [Bradyrhizobium betae]|uniref:Uncharacterized protein n=1 Tax=Bradyrhizobium betae TaxID=244734 RepID=A0A5P6PCP4_9BRAD|nr:hypothetical protein [Bradyrhizobium betae]MCS3729715.1 hypothetical protein [Bradyrhizobium betae]QFI76060.1 hypothetical protein F8237_28880 [Bradyrhizobium betae]